MARIFMTGIGIGLAVALAMTGCGGQDSGDAQTAAEPSVIAAELAPQAAAAVTAKFQRELKAEVLAAMNAGGAGHAIMVCNSRAAEIAEANAHQGAWTVTRVTDRPRVPSHMADAHQLEVLQKFADTAFTESHFGEWITGEAGDSAYVYYEAIRIGEICTNCHGNTDKLAQGVPERLAELYPQDQALGYEVGDLRGMYVVTMHWPQAKAPAQEMLKPADTAQGM